MDEIEKFKRATQKITVLSILLSILFFYVYFKSEFHIPQIESVPNMQGKKGDENRSHPTRRVNLCSPNFDKVYKVKSVKSPIPKLKELEDEYTWVQNGGHWAPKNCSSPTKLAVVVPYRDRDPSLKLFLKNMHPFLRKQLLDYTIIIVEQYGKALFNKAKLMNVGFIESLKIRDFNCFIFHDVDLFPEDYRNIYVCDSLPKHMSVSVESLNYNLPYERIFGGVVAFTKSQFEMVNGFCNLFWGWGGEDDDMGERVIFNLGHFLRIDKEIGRYSAIEHTQQQRNPLRFSLMELQNRRNHTDGLDTLSYTVKSMDVRKLYTWYLVDVENRTRTNRKRKIKLL